MTTLEGHINIFRNLYIPYKANIVRMMHHLYHKHSKEPFTFEDDTGDKMTLEEFIDAITRPRDSPVEPRKKTLAKSKRKNKGGDKA